MPCLIDDLLGGVGRVDHWRRGHKQMCKKIHRGGNAEHYNADKKYKEAVAVAVEACAEASRARGAIAPARHWIRFATANSQAFHVGNSRTATRVAARAR